MFFTCCSPSALRCAKQIVLSSEIFVRFWPVVIAITSAPQWCAIVQKDLSWYSWWLFAISLISLYWFPSQFFDASAPFSHDLCFMKYLCQNSYFLLCFLCFWRSYFAGSESWAKLSSECPLASAVNLVPLPSYRSTWMGWDRSEREQRCIGKAPDLPANEACKASRRTGWPCELG